MALNEESMKQYLKFPLDFYAGLGAIESVHFCEENSIAVVVARWDPWHPDGRTEYLIHVLEDNGTQVSAHICGEIRYSHQFRPLTYVTDICKNSEVLFIHLKECMIAFPLTLA